jgi:hypothetical protein
MTTRILGFYMLIQALLGLAIGHITLIRLLNLEIRAGFFGFELELDGDRISSLCHQL